MPSQGTRHAAKAAARAERPINNLAALLEMSGMVPRERMSFKDIAGNIIDDIRAEAKATRSLTA